MIGKSLIMLNLRFNSSQFEETKQEFQVSINQLNILILLSHLKHLIQYLHLNQVPHYYL